MSALVWLAVNDVGDTIDHYGGISSRIALSEENKKLKIEIARLESLSLHNDVLRSENATLRGMLSLREAHPEGIAAPILSNPSISPFGTFIIGSGSDDGVSVGDYVISTPRVAIGFVVEVDARTSLVRLFSAPDKITEVMIGDVRANYIGRGDGNGIFAIPRSIAIEIGGAVRLPGKSFAIGFVGAIKSDPEDAEAIVLVRVPANLPALSFVYVIPE